ncbi:hypothetical protein B0H16DRAFT_1459308 [Mycena metata]|uniref:Uncharacterized protein n=1 Tax=Mycena metata TaxID=1033252 RepID=A0AAD7NBX6_9AGAR|nr:hypothetical protein B0H16DRAFT_1459308 [Mycena metata]
MAASPSARFTYTLTPMGRPLQSPPDLISPESRNGRSGRVGVGTVEWIRDFLPKLFSDSHEQPTLKSLTFTGGHPRGRRTLFRAWHGHHIANCNPKSENPETHFLCLKTLSISLSASRQLPSGGGILYALSDAPNLTTLIFRISFCKEDDRQNPIFLRDSTVDEEFRDWEVHALQRIGFHFGSRVGHHPFQADLAQEDRNAAEGASGRDRAGVAEFLEVKWLDEQFNHSKINEKPSQAFSRHRFPGRFLRETETEPSDCESVDDLDGVQPWDRRGRYLQFTQGNPLMFQSLSVSLPSWI